MRTRKDLIYLNIKDLTEEEIEHLSDYDLNCCDNCGEIDLSEKLVWLDGEDYYDDSVAIKLLQNDKVSVCKDCYNKFQAENK
jgi:hypothetical protein